MLKPALARGELHCIGATTLDEYRKYVEKDAALERRFQKVFVGEPSVEDTIAILRGLKEKYAVHHGVEITDPGAEAQWDRGVVQRNFDVSPRATYLDSRQHMSSGGVFVDDEFRMSDAWRLNAGLRADRSDRGIVRLSPRLALIGTRADNRVVKLIVGQAYRSPNAYERYYQVDSDESAQLANPSLNAEHVQTAELFYSRSVGAHSPASCCWAG